MKQETLKMVIAGGRDFRGTEEDYILVRQAVKKYKITKIVSGKQKTWDEKKNTYYGADYFGELCATLLGVPLELFPAPWKKLGSGAGPYRNKLMAEYTKFVFLFPGGKGTASMRKEAKAAGKKIIYDNGWCE